ncbi:Methyl-accepting chemotaxis serine transducer [Labeo rohita]|uniref:Methyl-accepting chemotaxis serine transducer n=1 Tax=Labeo rohita TaxID=84645 RepID=A0ABQ8L0V3_LABRO|nr:Methyl-accepting chemotaxis serine transducer [Labeo rohita]
MVFVYLFLYLIDLIICYQVVADLVTYLGSNTVNTFITEPTQLTVLTECYNHTVTEYTEQNPAQWQIIIIISGLMNGLLVIVVIGLLHVFVGNRRSAEQSQLNADLQQMQVTEQHQDQLH